MKTHSIEWYESDDGKIFTDEMECIEYEAKLLYNESGVRFYTIDWEPVDFITKNDWTYNNSYYIVIDRSKEKENKLLIDYLNDNYGWCLVNEAFNRNEDTFILKWDKVVPVESHLVY